MAKIKTDMRNYNGERFSTITVSELIERLQDQDPDALVIFSTDYGDYHHTPQALPIDGNIEEVVIAKSAYSNSGFQLIEREEEAEEDNNDGDDEVEGPKILVIR